MIVIGLTWFSSLQESYSALKRDTGQCLSSRIQVWTLTVVRNEINTNSFVLEAVVKPSFLCLSSRYKHRGNS